MINNMLQYSLEVGICWAILYLVYIVFLRRETFFSVNRWYLLGSLLMGLIIPVLRMIPTALQEEVYVVNEALYFISAGPELIANNIAPAVAEEQSTISLYSILVVIYIIGHLFFGLRFVSGIKKIYRLYKNGDRTNKGNFTLVETADFHLPFSFLNCVFFSKELPLRDDVEKILKHELTHIQSWHTLDILFIEFLQIVFWFNPLIYLYKKAIKESHEYVADATVLRDTSQKIYGQILLRQSQSGLQIALANHFFQSHIKKRIKMMTQKKSKRPALIKYLVALPMILLLAILFQSQGIPEDIKQEENLSQENKSNVIILYDGIENSPEQDMSQAEIKFSGYRGVEFYSGEATVKKLGEKARGKVIVNHLKSEDLIAYHDSQKLEVYEENKDLRFKYTSAIRGSVEISLIDSGDNIVSNTFMEKTKDVLDFPFTDFNSEVETFKIKIGNEEEAIESPAFMNRWGFLNQDKYEIKPNLIPIRKEHLKKNIENVFGFGQKKHPIHKVNRLHKGIDLIADMDSPVYAAGDGVIIDATYSEGYGNHVKIEHNGNYTTLYAHLSSYQVEKGQKISKGQHIGKVGSTGKSTAPHLHYEVQENGIAIDPMPFLKEYISLKDSGSKKTSPLFPGCDNEECSREKLNQYINQNLVYPKSAKEQGLQGLNFAQVTIDEEGQIIDMNLIRSLDNATGQATLKLLSKMQNEIKWIPAKEGGETVSSKMFIKVKFELGGDVPYEDSYSTTTIENPELPGLYLHQNVGPKIFYSYYSDDNTAVEFVLQDQNGNVINTHKVQQHKPTEFTGFFDVKNSTTASYTISAKQSGNNVSKATRPFKNELEKEGKGKNDGACKADENGKYFWVERRPGLKSCNDIVDNETFLDCTQEKISTYFAENISYPEEAIKEGFQGLLIWMVTIDENGKIINYERPKNFKPYQFGYTKVGERIIEKIKEDFDFVPAQCDGQNVKSWYSISHRVKLSDAQKKQVVVRDKNSVESIFQNFNLSNASSEGNLGFTYESNLNVPFTVEVFNPNGQSVYKVEKDYMYKRYMEGFEIDNPINGTYTAVVSQDGQQKKASMDINIFNAGE